MKPLSAALIALSLGAQVFSAPVIEERQSNPVSVSAAVKRLLGTVLTDIFYISHTINGLDDADDVGLIKSDLASIVTALANTVTTISGSTGTGRCSLSTDDITTLIADLEEAQSIVSSIQSTLTQAANLLDPAALTAIFINVQAVEMALNDFITSLNAFASNPLPCLTTAVPDLLSGLQGALAAVSNADDALTVSLDMGGMLSQLIVTAVP